MKILVLSLYYPYPPDQGSNIRIFNLLKHLSSRHELDLISFGDVDSLSSSDELHKYCGAVTIVPEMSVRHGWVTKLASFFSVWPRSVTLNRSPAMVAAVSAQLAAVQYDCILVEWLWVASYVANVADLSRVLDDHNAEAAMFQRNTSAQTENAFRRARHFLTWSKICRYERWALERFDEITAVSDTDRERLLALGGLPNKVTTVPNGVDVGSMPFQDYPVVADRIVYPGHLTYEPNLDACCHFVQSILPRIQAVRPGVTFTITGRLPSNLPRSLTQAPGVQILGYVNDIRPVVGGSAICVVPLRLGGGTRLKILEAMALGTPVVATHIGAEGLAVNDGEHLLLVDDAADFAKSVVRLLDDSALRQQLAHAARQLVESHYDWESIAGRMESVLLRATKHSAVLKPGSTG